MNFGTRSYCQTEVLWIITALLLLTNLKGARQSLVEHCYIFTPRESGMNYFSRKTLLRNRTLILCLISIDFDHITQESAWLVGLTVWFFCTVMWLMISCAPTSNDQKYSFCYWQWDETLSLDLITFFRINIAQYTKR